MKIPKKIKIGGIIYRVKILDSNSYSDRSINEIGINVKLSKEQKQVAFLHEILHLINLEIKEETLIESMAQSLYQIFTDNKIL